MAKSRPRLPLDRERIQGSGRHLFAVPTMIWRKPRAFFPRLVTISVQIWSEAKSQMGLPCSSMRAKAADIADIKARVVERLRNERHWRHTGRRGGYRAACARCPDMVRPTPRDCGLVVVRFHDRLHQAAAESHVAAFPVWFDCNRNDVQAPGSAVLRD